MNVRRLYLAALFLVPVLCSGASKEIVELQRDMAQLQDQVRTLQRTLDERMATLQTLLTQALDASTKANTGVAVMQSGLQERLREQEKKVAEPVAGVGAKVDQMTAEFQGVRESVADMNARMGKLEQRIIDLSNAVKTLPTPASPPPPVVTPGAGPSFSSGAPPVPAEVLYQNALRDRSGGKYDLALQEFTDYLRYYGNTDLAPNAQFYIGDIHASQGDLETAVKDFDLVLEKYPPNNKTPDALYMKGQSLVKLGRRTQGAKEFQDLIRRYPRHDLSSKAAQQLKGMGLSPGPPSRSSAAKRRR